MRARAVLIALAAFLGIAAVAVFIGIARSDTTLEFSLRDSVSRQWVWDATARLQGRLILSFFQSDAGPVPLVFSHLKPGKSVLAISAPGYLPVTVPVSIRRGVNRLARPIDMVGIEIPGLSRFLVTEQWEGGDIVAHLLPVDADGRPLANHPCLPLWAEARVSAQVRDGRPVTEPAEAGSARGTELFRGRVDWQWDASPESQSRYALRIPGAAMKPDAAPFLVIDYLVVVTDPRVAGPDAVGELMRNAPALSDSDAIRRFLGEKGLHPYFVTSWNVRAGEE